jgi:hypothetical protein
MYGRRSGALLAAEVEDKANFSFGSNGVDFRLGLNVVVQLSLAGGNSYTPSWSARTNSRTPLWAGLLVPIERRSRKTARGEEKAAAEGEEERRAAPT